MTLSDLRLAYTLPLTRYILGKIQLRENITYLQQKVTTSQQPVEKQQDKGWKVKKEMLR